MKGGHLSVLFIGNLKFMTRHDHRSTPTLKSDMGRGERPVNNMVMPATTVDSGNIRVQPDQDGGSRGRRSRDHFNSQSQREGVLQTASHPYANRPSSFTDLHWSLAMA